MFARIVVDLLQICETKEKFNQLYRINDFVQKRIIINIKFAHEEQNNETCNRKR